MWTDYYQEEEEDLFGNGFVRNYRQLSQKRQLLPSLRHFRLLPHTDELFELKFETAQRTNLGTKAFVFKAISNQSAPRIAS